ncbi:DUF6069 family protein [Streptomyces sp. JNUCC 64]
MPDNPTAPRATAPTRVRALAVVGAVVADALIWVLARTVFDVDLRTPDGPGSTTATELPFPAVPIAVAVVSLLGWALLAVLERRTARGPRLWTGAAVAVLLLSLVAPLFATGLTAGSRITLVLLHLTVGAILIPAFRQGAPARA